MQRRILASLLLTSPDREVGSRSRTQSNIVVGAPSTTPAAVPPAVPRLPRRATITHQRA